MSSSRLEDLGRTGSSSKPESLDCCPKIYRSFIYIDNIGTESYMRRKHRMEFYYTGGSTCTCTCKYVCMCAYVCVCVLSRIDRTETPLYRNGYHDTRWSLGGNRMQFRVWFDRFFFIFFFFIGARKLRLLAFVATLVRALAPHPISGWNRRFGIPTLDLIFLQHGCLERTKEQGDISFVCD